MPMLTPVSFAVCHDSEIMTVETPLGHTGGFDGPLKLLMVGRGFGVGGAAGRDVGAGGAGVLGADVVAGGCVVTGLKLNEGSEPALDVVG
jgi:hypothetical protein